MRRAGLFSLLLESIPEDPSVRSSSYYDCNERTCAATTYTTHIYINPVNHKLHIFRTLLSALALLALNSCGGLIYDDEGDCDPYYKVRFVYDRNLEYADAFVPQVREVTLYVVDDATGHIVWQKHESGAALREPGYMMDVDVPPGTYSLIAWCGEGHRSHFSVAESDVHTGLTCRLDERAAHPENLGLEGSAVTACLKPLFHGRLMASVFPDEQGVHVYTVVLTKDTNDINVQLVQRYAPTVSADDYIVTVTDRNGFMDWDNTLLDDEQLTYYPWQQAAGTAEMLPSASADAPSAGEWVPSLSADITTARITTGSDMRLKIYHRERGLICSLPLVKYFLMSKGQHAHLAHQDYLDYCSSYRIVVYLEGSTMTQLFINSWRVVLQDSDL